MLHRVRPRLNLQQSGLRKAPWVSVQVCDVTVGPTVIRRAPIRFLSSIQWLCFDWQVYRCVHITLVMTTLHLLCTFAAPAPSGTLQGNSILNRGSDPQWNGCYRHPHPPLSWGSTLHCYWWWIFTCVYIIFNTMAMYILGTFTDLHSLYLSLLGYPYVCPYTSLFTYTLLWNLRLISFTSVIGNWHPGRGVQQSELVRQALCVWGSGLTANSYNSNVIDYNVMFNFLCLSFLSVVLKIQIGDQGTKLLGVGVRRHWRSSWP